MSALLRDTLGTGALLLLLALELLIASLHHGAFPLLFFLLSSPFVSRLPPVPLHSQLLLCLFLLNVFFHLSFFFFFGLSRPCPLQLASLHTGDRAQPLISARVFLPTVYKK